MTTIAVSTCRGAMRDAMIYIKGQISYESFLGAVDLWLGASHLPFRHIQKGDLDKYVIQHELGKKWSLYLSTVINSILNEIGYRTSDQRIDEQSVSFEISKAGKV